MVGEQFLVRRCKSMQKMIGWVEGMLVDRHVFRGMVMTKQAAKQAAKSHT
jgi:hypothetical protein